MDSLLLFSGAIVKKWWTLMSCAMFTFLGLYSLVFQKSNAWVIAASVIAGLGLFFWAAFLAWDEEHKARVKAESDLVAPKIDLNWELAGIDFGTRSGEKHLIVENSGAVDAYDLQIQDLSLTPNLKATFDQITRLQPKGRFVTDPWLTGKGISFAPSKARDFEMILFSSGDLPSEYTTLTSGGNLAEIRCPLVVSFKDCSGNRYEASFEFITDTLRHIDKIRYIKRVRL
jgi:hypothetical protein